MKKQNKWSIWLLMLIAFFVSFGGVISQTSAAMPESSLITHYNKYGDRIGYFDDGYLYWSDRISPATSGVRWHIMGYRVKVTANGRTAYADYSIGGGTVNPFKTKSSGIKAESVNSGSYRYTRDGLNYNNLIDDITKKNSTLGRDMSSGNYDVKIVFDSITEIYNAGSMTQLSGNHYTASSLKSALSARGMGTGAVDNYYGMTTNIAKSQLPIVKFVTKAVSFPSGGGYHSGGETYYVKPGKLVYLDSTYYSQKVNMTNHYIVLGDRRSTGAEVMDDYLGRYDYSSRNFVQTNGSPGVTWSSNSSGPALANKNTNVKVRNAFSLNGNGQTWWTYTESRNENGVYYGGSEMEYKYMYAFITDSADPTFGGIPSETWRNTDLTFTPTVADSGSGIKVARLKLNGTTVQTITKTTRDTSESYATRTASGVANYVLEAEDNVGNTASKSFTVNIDKALPTLSVAQSPSAWTNGSVTLTATASDALSGIKSIKLPNGNTVSGGSASQTVTSNGTYKFIATDVAGNTRTLDVDVSNIEKVAPTGTTSQTPTAWTNDSVTVNLTAVADTGGSGVKNIKLPNGTFVTGTSASYTVPSNQSVSFVIYDNAGNSTTKTHTVSNIDKVAPTGNISQVSTAWTNASATLNLTSIADSGGSGVKNIKLPNGNFVTGTSASAIVTENGTHSFVIYDNAGNATTKSITVTNIDKIAPTANLNQTPTAWTKGSVTLNLTSVADAGGSGVKNIKLPNGNIVTGTSASQIVPDNGTYVFRVYDNAGNYTDKSITVTNIDQTAPTGTLSQNPTAWTKDNVTLTLSGVSDGSGSGLKHIVRPDNSLVTGTTSATFSATSNGTYTFKMVDNVGNESTRSIKVENMDETLPTAKFNPNSFSWTNANRSIDVTLSDTGGSGVNNWRSRISTNNGSTYGAWSSYATGSNGTVALSAHGLNRIQVEVNDNVGNQAIVTSGTYQLDKVLPNGTVTPNTTAWTSGTVTLTANGTDSDSGVASIKKPDDSVVSASSTTFLATANGLYSFVVTDKAGNERIISYTVKNIDKTEPTGTLTQTPTTWTNGSVTLNLNSIADTGGSGVKNVKLPNGDFVTGTSASQTVTANGTYSFVIYDNVGNTTTKSITVSNIEKTAPTGTLTQTPTAWTNDSVTLNLTSVADSGGSGLKNIKLPNGSFVTGTSASAVVTANGTFSFVIYDNAGNTTTKTITVSNIEKIAPTATLTQTPTAWTQGSVTLNLTSIADTGGSGLKNTKLPNGNLVSGTSASQIVTDNGTYTFTVYDNAGNATNKSITVTNIDKTAPTGLLSRNPSTWTNGNVTLTLSGVSDGSGSGIKHIVRPDNSLVTGASSATFIVTANGTYTFKMVDNVGNESTRSISVTNIDKTLPSATLNPNSMSWTNANQSIAVTLADTGGSELKNWRSRISTNNGSTYGAWSSYSTGTTGNVSLSAHGLNRIQVEVNDNAGNQRVVTSGTYQLDKVLPNGTVTPNTTAWTSGTVTLTASGTDADSGVSTIEKPDGSNVTASSTTYVVSANGTYNFVVTDNAGNARTVSYAVTNIDKIAPNGTLTQNPTAWTSGNVTLNLTGVTDTGGANVKDIRLPNGTIVTGTSASQVVTANGTYSFVITDNAGNTKTLSITVSNIDKTAPTGTLTQTPTAWTKGNVTLNLTGVADSGSGIQHIKLPNGTLTTNTAVAYTVTANGTYVMEIEDNVGNKTTRSITVTNIDKVLPVLSLSYDYKVNVIRATATDALSGVESIKLPNGTVVTGATANFTPPSTGKYTFTATDRAGNVATRTMNIQSPGIEVGADTEDWTNQDVVLTAEAFSAISVIDYIILPNGVKVYAEEATYSATTNGTYSFTAFDKSGFSITESITVSNIDKVKPAGSVTMTPGTSALTLEFTGTDAHSGVSEIVLPNGNSVSGTTASQTVTKPGSYTAVVMDVAGNTTDVVATVQAPTVIITKEVSTWTNLNSFGLTASTTPRYSGTAKMQASFASASWLTANQVTAQINQNGTYEFSVNDGGIVSTASVTVTNFDREEPIITITEKAKSTTQGTYNIRITEIGDVKP